MIVPYDGKSIGEFGQDTVGLSNGYLDFYSIDPSNVGVAFNASGPFTLEGNAITSRGELQLVKMNSNIFYYTRAKFTIPRSGNETAGASIAVAVYISY